MAKYQMDLNEFSFNKIRAGRRIDLRLFDKKRQALKIGDVIEYININNPSEKMECDFLGMAIFENFGTLIDCLTPQMIGYQTKEDLMLRIERIYPSEMQKQFNVAALFLRPKVAVARGYFRDETENERER
ncbi:MAG: hypothetical protein IJ770_05710 [Alphaproteobacteria bacterium]|nr:hypothetical protein [Alphaproteobacteria bacterium]